MVDMREEMIWDLLSTSVLFGGFGMGLFLELELTLER